MVAGWVGLGQSEVEGLSYPLSVQRPSQGGPTSLDLDLHSL